MRATRNQTERLLAWSAPFAERVWAVEGAGGLGYLLGQQLVDAGETVVDVPATLAARTRVLASGRSNKTDPNDAWSVAITALRHETLCRVEPASHTEVLRLLAKRNTDIGNQRCRLVSRLHSLLVELALAGSPRKSTLLTWIGSLPLSPRRHRVSRSATTWRSSCSTTSAASTPN